MFHIVNKKNKTKFFNIRNILQLICTLNRTLENMLVFSIICHTSRWWWTIFCFVLYKNNKPIVVFTDTQLYGDNLVTV